MQVSKSNKLANVCYDIRGPVLKHAKRLEEEGHRILKLNIGNPAPFGFEAPDEILQDVIRNLPTAQGYSDSKGLFSARKAVMQYYQQKQVEGVGIEDIYLGNGVSELIVMSMQALLNNGDEVLVPAPDYPLWTAAVSLSGGNPVHYLCDEQANWFPDLADIKAKITPNTKALVIINPNNPTGAVYSREVLLGMLELARQHNLVVFSDEIYDKILYDDAVHICTASLAPDLLCLTFNGLSKSYRVAGFRSGWVVISGPKHHAQSYIEGIDMLANMRLCANVPSQHAIQTALGGYQSINDLVLPRAGCWNSAIEPGNCSTTFPASVVSSRWARCMPSRGSTRRSARSTTMKNSSSTCCCPRSCWWSRARRSTGHGRITSAS